MPAEADGRRRRPADDTDRPLVAVAVLASFVAFLDGSVVNLALPSIGREFGGGLALQQWVVDGYLLTLGALILVAGAISDQFGRLKVLRAGWVPAHIEGGVPVPLQDGAVGPARARWESLRSCTHLAATARR